MITFANKAQVLIVDYLRKKYGDDSANRCRGFWTGMRGPKVSITTALDCHPSTYRLFYCESTLMGHALVGRSIILPANPRSVHRLAKELPLASEPPAPPYPHLRNQGSARAARTARCAQLRAQRTSRRAGAHTVARQPCATQTAFTQSESVQHRRPWAKSHCLSLPPSLPPAPLRPSSAGPHRPAAA